jgi:hypothetical protein
MHKVCVKNALKKAGRKRADRAGLPGFQSSTKERTAVATWSTTLSIRTKRLGKADEKKGQGSEIKSEWILFFY